MQYKRFLPLLLITTLALMAVTLYNGFPMVEQDTGAYIQQAIYPHFAPDRTPFYGLFLRVTSLWSSLWLTILWQCFILAYLVLSYIRLLTTTGTHAAASSFRFYLFSVIAIVCFTCVSWVCAYLMPDVFGGILLLGTLLYLSDAGAGKIARLGYLAIILAAVAIHSSHFLILALFAAAMLIWAGIKKQKQLAIKCLVLIGLSFAFWLFMCCANARKDRGFAFSQSSSVFMTAKLAEAGILKIYLDERCATQPSRLCDYKDHIPTNFDAFLWAPESPFTRMGGFDSIATIKKEYGTVVHNILTTPRYAAMFAGSSATGTLKELTQIQASDRIQVFLDGSEPWLKIRQFFSDELARYTASRQNNKAISTNVVNIIYLLFFIASSLWVVLLYTRVGSSRLTYMYMSIILFLLVNALVTATFSTVIYRYQYRVFWVLPATNIIVLLKYYWSRYQNSGLND